MSVDRLVFASLLGVAVLAAAVGHDTAAVPKAGASPTVTSVGTAIPVEGETAVEMHLPAGRTHVTAPSDVVFEPSRPVKWLPSGKGMWIYEPAKTEGGNVAAIIAKAKATGLTHLWVRMGSAWDGFNVVPFVNQLLPAAHAAGIRIIGWDFPKLEPVEADVQRALTMIRHTAPGGHRIDAFSADIETRAEGTRISAESAKAYGAALRAGAGPDYTLIVTVPRPSKEKAGFPWAEVQAGYDAIAPMVYWLDRQPDTDVAGALRDLARFNKPVYPVGQAYDGSPEGGRKGVPPPEELFRFLRTAQAVGAAGVSFWSWQAANQPAWDTIREATEFRPPPPAPPVLEHIG
jgi:hypothetical protein